MAEATARKIVNRSVTPAPPLRLVHSTAPTIQCRGIRVSSPTDAAEKEAEATAQKVVRMPAPAHSAGPLVSPYTSRFSGAIPRLVQRAKAEGQPDVGSNVAAELTSSTASGSPLPLGVRRFMEPRFNADFSGVRVHTGAQAASMNRQFSAQAFTVGNNIFFGRERFKPETDEGRELVAHELTHTIQQGAVSQTPAVQRSVDPAAVTERTTPHVQRLGISDALDYFADKANYIPGYRMFTIVLGVNPINMSRVERSAANIMRAIVEFIPGGGLITEALDKYGVFDRVGNWVEQQISSLGMTGGMIKAAIGEFLDSLSWRDIFRLGSVWDRAKRIFTEPIGRIISFAKNLITGILRFIREAVLRPLAALAEGTRGYDLLKAVLGQDPVTGDPYPRNADTLIGGFMKLIGQEEIWENIKKSGAIAKCWAWFQGALTAVISFVRQIPQLFIQALTSLEIADLVLLPRAFVKVGKVFGSFVASFITWAGNAVWNLLEIIFSVVAPGVMPYLQKARAAFRTILKNPIGFVGNLVRAGKAGFNQFATNIGAHLKASLIGWLTGSLASAAIYIPQSFEIREIVKFVLSVLGLTWANIRAKLVKAIGETAVKALETGFDIVKTLVTEGPAAAWEKIKEQLANLKEMILGEITNFVVVKVVQSAIIKLVSMLNPAGAFIQAIIATYNTVMFFIERIKQIAQVAMAFIDSIAAIASGVIAAAANKVESTLAGLLTLAISFLARLIGLGKVSDIVVNIVNKIRAPIDKALDKVVDWIVTGARKVGGFIAQAGVPQDPNERLRLAARAAVAAARALRGRLTAALLEPALAGIKLRYGLTDIRPYERAGAWWARIVINPLLEEQLTDGTEGAGAAAGAGSEVQALIGTKIVDPVPNGPARLALPGGKTEIPGYQIRLGTADESASIRKVRRPSGAPEVPDVHIDDAGFLRAGLRDAQRRSDQDELFAKYVQLATDLGYGDIPSSLSLTAANISETNNSKFRGALRKRILDDPKYAALSELNKFISERKNLTGPGMQGELFEGWVIKWFGSRDGIQDRKVSYKVPAGAGKMDRYSGSKIIEIKSRVRPAGVDPKVADDAIPKTKFDIKGEDADQFTRYSQLLAGQDAGGQRMGYCRVGGIPTPIGPFDGAKYYFNFRGARDLFVGRMPAPLAAVTETYVGGQLVT